MVFTPTIPPTPTILLLHHTSYPMIRTIDSKEYYQYFGEISYGATSNIIANIGVSPLAPAPCRPTTDCPKLSEVLPTPTPA